jgi:protein SCO1/2
MKIAIVALLLMARAAYAHVGPHPEAGVEFDQHVGAALPLSLPFTNARGVGETLAEAMAGAPAVLVFGYLGCRDLCSMTVPGVAEALRGAGLRPGHDYRAVFADIAPEEDASMLAEGPARVSVEDRAGWSFLGANADSIRTLAAAAGFRYRYEPQREAYAHPAGFMVLTPEGRVSRYFMGVRFEPAEVREALGAARAGRSGSLTDRLLLLCYHFDPATGRYSAAIVQSLRAISGAALVLGAVVFAWRRTRRTS